MAKKKESRRRPSGHEEPLPLAAPVRGWFGVQLAVVLVVVIGLVVVAWARPRACGDFYVALAAGRDIIETRLSCLTEPDTWSFRTTDKRWFDQNWGTHVLFYVTWAAGGEWGELLLKAGILGAMGIFITMRCRQRGVDWPLAILTGGAAVAAARAFIDMRPNLMTLMFAPLMAWLLLRTRRNPHQMWVALGVLVLWSNVHGGFLLGIAMMGLWTLCWVGAHAVRRGFLKTLEREWPLPAATVAAIILAGTLSPYGLENLTHSLVVGGSEEWRGISEWRAIHIGDFGSTWEFFTTVGMIVGLSALSSLIYLVVSDKRRLRLKAEHLILLGFSMCLCVVLLLMALNLNVGPDHKFRPHQTAVLAVSIPVLLVGGVSGAILFLGLRRRGPRGPRYPVEKPTPGDVATVIFELALAVVVIAMAIEARRFISLAIVLLAPIVAVQVEWLYRAIGRAWVIFPLAAALIVPVFLTPSDDIYRAPGPSLYKQYHPDNPLYPPLSPFERMLLCKNYPFGGTQFIVDNNVSGRVFHDWRWEGFLRWRTPHLKLFMGGRAQQVYDEETFDLFRRIIQRTEHQTLSKLGMHLVVIPEDRKHRKLIEQMVWGPDAQWAYVYWNDGKAIFADVRSPQMLDLVKRVVIGEAKYPSEDIAAISRAMCLASRIVKSTNQRLAQAFKDAIARRPRVIAYRMLGKMNARGQIASKDLIAYLEQERSRLDAMPIDLAGGVDIINCRGVVAAMLFELNKRTGNGREAGRWKQVAAEDSRVAAAMKERWR